MSVNPQTPAEMSPNYLVAAMSERMEMLSREVSRAQNHVFLDDLKVIELARRYVRGPVTEGHVRDWWGSTAGNYGNPHFGRLSPEIRSQILDMVGHFCGLMATE